MEILQIGIRDLCEFVGKSGSITNQFALAIRAIEGTKIHQQYQLSQPQPYFKESYIQYDFNYNNLNISLNGRIDGMLYEGSINVIEEIKSTYVSLEDIDSYTSIAHYYQAMLYGYCFCKNHGYDFIKISLVYIHAASKEVKKIHYYYYLYELESVFYQVIDEYLRFYNQFKAIENETLESLKTLDFPYPNKRAGQSEMMNSVYIAHSKHQKLFLQAATGLGKTLGVLYPTLKAFLKGYNRKIFYLTAKRITRSVAIDTMNLLIEKGLKINWIVINSKDHMCLLDKRNCNPEVCPYALNYYDRVNPVLYDTITKYHYFDEQLLKEIGLQNNLCPFELSLDLLHYSHLALLDYNYAFDPRVCLESSLTKETTLLVDEAHNLVDRSRDMYSAILNRNTFVNALNYVEHKRINKLIRNIISYFDKFINQDYFVTKEPPYELYEHILYFISEAYDYLQKHKNVDERFIDCFYECTKFKLIYEYFDDSYCFYYENETIHLFCIHPTDLLKDTYAKCSSTIFFSASLLPIQYFYSILGGEGEDKKYYFASTFDINKRKVLVANDCDTRYQYRKNSIPIIAQYIYRLQSSKVGNYLVLFPSYEYMNQVYDIVKATYVDLCIYKQNSNMSDKERYEFLSLFKKQDHSQIFFSILGGLFSEGIDFKGDSLIGTIIVGTGLPQLGLERDIIRDFYEDNGYDYAYKYPGFNKVLQGAGRVIRTEEDEGIVLLLDYRYLQPTYLKMFPKEWANYEVVNLNTVYKKANEFWTKRKSNY